MRLLVGDGMSRRRLSLSHRSWSPGCADNALSNVGARLLWCEPDALEPAISDTTTATPSRRDPVVDGLKFVAAAAKYDGDPWDLACGKAPLQATLPLIAVSTIPATSSELNNTSVMSYEKIQRKEGFANNVMRPKVALLDPELTYSIPLKQTAYSARQP